MSYIPSQSKYKQVAVYTSGENHVSLRVIGSPAVPASLTNLTYASLADLDEYCKDKVGYSGFIAYFLSFETSMITLVSRNKQCNYLSFVETMKTMEGTDMRS